MEEFGRNDVVEMVSEMGGPDLKKNNLCGNAAELMSQEVARKNPEHYCINTWNRRTLSVWKLNTNPSRKDVISMWLAQASQPWLASCMSTMRWGNRSHCVQFLCIPAWRSGPAICSSVPRLGAIRLSRMLGNRALGQDVQNREMKEWSNEKGNTGVRAAMSIWLTELEIYSSSGQ